MNQLTNIFKLLSDDTRLRILLLLYQEDLCVCEISGILNIPQPRVSQIFSKLRDLNLVSDERVEKFVFYSLKKQDDFFIQILEQVMNQKSSYPQLKIDSERLANKKQFFNPLCKTPE